MMIDDILSLNASKFPNKIALVYGDRRFSFGELNERANRLSQAFSRLGIQAGDRVAMRARNCTQFVEFFFAAAKCRAIAVPINPFLKEREVEYIIRDSGTQLMIISEGDIPFMQSLPRVSLGIKHTICLERGTPEVEDYESLLLEAGPEETPVGGKETDPAMIVYTSGTTGRPKGVTLSHKNCIIDARHIVMEMLLEHHHKLLLLFPFFHTAAISQTFRTYYVGATLVMASTDSVDILKTLELERITDMIIVPTLLNALCHTPGIEQYDLRSLRLITYGASIIPVEHLKRAIEIFKCGFLQVFGTTETSPCITALRLADHQAALDQEEKRGLLSSCGRAMVGVETKVVDKEDGEVAIGEVGELCVRGENVMLGYWNKPEETASALRNGWYHTGDLARQDGEGYIYIVDRIKDIIISGGENIASREVEEVLYAHPAVLEAAVIGVPDPYWGESIKGIVVLKKGLEATEQELIDFCKAHLASFKKPKSIELVKELPKTPSGKILKTELRKRYEA
ncbi:MAG: long-chain-fatty-acid--CoA ligase [Deltaproteobacteria bacterium]|nr:long-chain-fatty-acid--CoA ligase [Deltaproteobacteria bacterium]